MSWIQILKCCNLGILSWGESLSLATILDCFESLKRCLHILIDQNANGKYVLVIHYLVRLDLLHKFGLCLFQSLYEVNKCFILLKIIP